MFSIPGFLSPNVAKVLVENFGIAGIGAVLYNIFATFAFENLSKSIVYFKARFNIKKAIALSFLLFASTIIAAHAVIPHQHYDDIQLINQCDNGDVEDCPLATVYVKLSGDKQVIRSLDFNFDWLPCFSIWFPGYSIPQTTDNIGLPFRQKPYLPFYPADYISQSFGWRAPPV